MVISHHSWHETNHGQPSYQFTISHQISLCGMRLIVMCATSSEKDTHFTFVRLCIVRLAHICMQTTFSVPTQYDIYFFMYGNSSSYCWSEDDCCVQPAEKSLSFMCDICASCIVQRYVRFTVICREPPPQYPLNIIYTFLLHWVSSIRQVGGWYR